MVIVPEPVTGPPDVVSPVVPPETSTLVTVPTPPDVIHDVFVPSVERTLPLLPLCDGSRAFTAAFGVVCPVPPFAMATVPVTFAAVPVVFWFSVGTSAAWIADITTSVPFPLRYCPDVVAPAKASIAACLSV